MVAPSKDSRGGVTTLGTTKLFTLKRAIERSRVRDVMDVIGSVNSGEFRGYAPKTLMVQCGEIMPMPSGDLEVAYDFHRHILICIEGKNGECYVMDPYPFSQRDFYDLPGMTYRDRPAML